MTTVDEVYLPLSPDDGNSWQQRPRRFQQEFAECIRQGDADIIQLVAPTGSGKTACFEHLLDLGEKVLLLYPTNALIASQIQRFKEKGYAAVTLSAKDLRQTGVGRSRELWGFIARHDIILTNPDIFQAIIGRMYCNPEENLLDAFRQFSFVIYDEFHAYREFELSGILMQIALFQNGCFSRVILSSATPKHEVIDLLAELVRIGKERLPPTIAEIVARPMGSKDRKEGSRIRYRTDVSFYRGKILDHFEDVVQMLSNALPGAKDGEPTILLIFDTVRESNQFFRRLHQEHPVIYAFSEKDNGYDTNQIGEKPDLTKPILISTNKSEVGLDYPISLLFMEEGYNFDSFVQRFGRAARHEPAECHFFTQKAVEHLFPTGVTRYQDFLEIMSGISSEFSINVDDVRTLFTLRQALAIDQYKQRKEDLKGYFASSDKRLRYTVWTTFFSILKNRNPALANKDMDLLACFIDDIKIAGQSLRGRALQCNVRYTRGHEVRQTMYDLLSVLNRTPVKVKESAQGIELEETVSEMDGPFIQAITLPYIAEPIEYPIRKEALKAIILPLADRALWNYSQRQKTFLLHYLGLLLNSIEPDRMLAPQEVILWDNRVISVT